MSILSNLPKILHASSLMDSFDRCMALIEMCLFFISRDTRSFVSTWPDIWLDVGSVGSSLPDRR